MEFQLGVTPPPASAPASDGLCIWRQERERQMQEFSLKHGLPLHAEVEVMLLQGIRLRGRLYLEEESFWPDGDRRRIMLRVGSTPFRFSELESVVRLG